MDTQWIPVDSETKMPLGKTLLFCTTMGNNSEPVHLTGIARGPKENPEANYFFTPREMPPIHFVLRYWMAIPEVNDWPYSASENETF